MTTVTRRNFLAGAGAYSLSPVIPFTRWSGSHADVGEPIIADEDGLPHGCIFARTDCKQSATDGKVVLWPIRSLETDRS